MANRQRRYSGFTLLEALVAGLILGSAVIALCGVSNRCLSRTKINRHYDLAWQVADRQLTFIESMGINQFILDGETEGVIEQFGPEFSWAIDIREEPLDDLYLVTITVNWQEQNRIEQISLATMFNGLLGGALPITGVAS